MTCKRCLIIFLSTNYYPFGSVQPGRSYNNGSYRYGYNGHEMDNEVKGVGNHVSFGDYGNDPRLGRRWNLDPQAWRIPGVSPYAINHNNPIVFTDPNGEFGFIGAAIGAAVGAIAGGVIAAATGGDWKKGAIAGAVSGAIAGSGVGLIVAAGGIVGMGGAGVAMTGIISGSLGAGAGTIAGQKYEMATGARKEGDYDGMEVGVSMSVGMVTGMVGNNVSQALDKPIKIATTNYIKAQTKRATMQQIKTAAREEVSTQAGLLGKQMTMKELGAAQRAVSTVMKQQYKQAVKEGAELIEMGLTIGVENTFSVTVDKISSEVQGGGEEKQTERTQTTVRGDF